ncbi:MAG: Potassium channel [Fimbriimonadaceae bacterium]|nr:Potassium channel [Fimbriimonadaceae bacterium]
MTQHHEPEWGKSRMEAITDGVFAIAITLLVFNFKIDPSIETEAGLNKALAALLPDIFAFVLSFFVLAGAWIGHHATMRSIREVSRELLWTNLFYLMFVAVMPFASHIFGRFMDLKLASYLYSGNILMIGLLQVRFWSQARSMASVLQPGLTAYALNVTTLRAWVLPITAVLSLGVTLADPRYGGMVYGLIPLFFVLANRRAKALAG